jgi:predicted RND superfamily exporter protein
MGNLEHNIKEAFAANDAKTKLANKGGMWNRLDNQMGRRKGVAAFWRIAAVLLGVFLLTGAFAAITYKTKQQVEIDQMEKENTSLHTTIDSLISLPAIAKTEIQIIEKEKVVYRDRETVQQNLNSEKYWEKRYGKLADSSDLIFASNKKQQQEIILLTEELAQMKQEFIELEQSIKTETKEESTAPFELKSERVDLDVSKKPAIKNPDLKMKVFQKNFIENRNNLNKNIFKK